MIESLQQIDISVFGFINGTLTHPWLDVFLETSRIFTRHRLFDVVAFAAVLFFSIRKFKRKAWRPIFGLIIAVAISDLFSYRVLKANIERPRPFQNESLHGVRKLTDAHGNSFPSNHAANCVAAAFILAICFPRRRYLFYIFAALVCYSRVYLGVHYPSDVLGGAFVGLTAGCLAAFFTVFQLKHWSPLDQ